VSGGIVTFEPGARSAWHTHPLGQILIVTAGKGWTQCEGGPIVEINTGDIICCPSQKPGSETRVRVHFHVAASGRWRSLGQPPARGSWSASAGRSVITGTDGQPDRKTQADEVSPEG